MFVSQYRVTMNDRLNTFIDDDGLSESTSLTHLLNCSDHSELMTSISLIIRHILPNVIFGI